MEKNEITGSAGTVTDPDRAEKFSGSGSQAGETKDPAQKKRKRQCCKRTGHSNSRQHDVKRGDGCDHLHLAGRPNLRR